MAEISVALLIAKISALLGVEALRYASTVVSQESYLLRQVHSKLKPIATEFGVMLAFLRQLDVQGGEIGAGQAWVDQVREAALEVEDIIDEYTYLQSSGNRRWFRDYLRSIVGRTPKAGSWLDIAHRLQDIDANLQRLSRMKETYCSKTIVEGEATPSHDAERWRQRVVDPSHQLPDDDGFVGMERSKTALLGWVTDQEPQHKLISVWGMGGLGKTTLVTKVYKSQQVKENFHSHAWVTVSEAYTVDELVRKIVKEFFGKTEMMCDIDNMSHGAGVIERLHAYLQGKSFLLVLDDVWSTGTWRGLNDVLTVSNCRSRIILTTRIRDVALLGNHVMELQPLDKHDSWVLFCRRAFCKETEVACPSHLEQWARAILDKCGGLPLAIVALGSLLSLKDKDESEWRKVYYGLHWQLINNPELLHLKNILFLSFKHLPDYLKPCFLYCSMFPEDYFITRRRLTKLWVAEGLALSRGRLTMEEVAEDNLNQLIHRGMLQVAERNAFGKVKSCRMHDMMREVAIQISETKKFCSIHDNPEKIMYTKARRLSIHNTPQAIQESSENWISRLRSFLLFDGNLCSMSSSFSTLTSGFKLLQVLDLQGAPIERIPKNVYQLFNLRYLSLRNTGITEISESLEKLCNLETLDLKGTNVKKLPGGITKLTKLRHLIVNGTATFPIVDTSVLLSGTTVPRGIWNLTNLQTRRTVEANDGLVRHARNLVKLTHFEIISVRATDCAELCVSLSKMTHLRKLAIIAGEKDGEMLELDTISSPPQYLQKLVLGGGLKNDALPHWFCSLRNLKELFLHWSRLRENPIPLLHESFPNLASLGLVNVYEGGNLLFQAGWFPKLKMLLLGNMPFRQVYILKGALATLDTLCLMNCPELKHVPSGIQHLTALEELYMFGMSSELVERFRADGHALEKVRHIQSILHAYRKGGQTLCDNLKVAS